jgi:outer membrane protein assembly factor BamA
LKKGRIHITILILIVLSLASCNPALKVERRSGYILVQNTIKNKNAYLPSDELEGFIQQNSMQGRLAPYFRPGVYFYEKSMKGKETRFKLWIRKSLGTKPIILDSSYVLSSADKLGIYLQNKGFYHSSVTQTIRYKRKTAAVTYYIHSGPPRIVNEFKYVIPDQDMNAYVMSDTSNGKLRNGMIYDTYVLDDERDRIANILRNNSYFNFSLSDIYYIADTFNAGLSANVEMHFRKIRMPIPGTSDSTAEIQHPRFYINNIYINTDADPVTQELPTDTLVYNYRANKADTLDKTIYVLYHDKLSLKPSFIVSSLAIAPGDAYSQAEANRTYKKFISQPIIGSANVNMAIRNPENVTSQDKQWLDCTIRLKKNQLNTFSIGTEGTNSGGRFGMGVNTSIQNRNLFKGAEVLSLKLKASAEVQGSLNNQAAQLENYFLFFNTLEGGAEVSIDFPRLLIPYWAGSRQNMRLGRTSLSAGGGIELQTEFRRRVSSLAWTYKWNKTERVRHIFTPLEFNYIKVFPSDSFQNYLNSLNDPVYKSQYTDHLLTMIRYSIIISNSSFTKRNNQYFLKLSAETSGNIPYLIDNISNRSVTEEGAYERFGVRYDEYFRFDADYRRFWKLRFGNVLGMRLMGGSAFAYGNSKVVPFEKSFWLGGANDMRGWRLRSLGPGAYVDSVNKYDKTGDIMLQATIEHRFPIYSFLLGSVFIDAGNVWLRNPSEDFPGGEFKLNTFYKQIAMDIGFGLRFDFSFFILRLDGAVPFHTPSKPDQWFAKEDFTWRNSILNFGIGYPF